MHLVQTGLWEPRPPSKHPSPVPAPPPSNVRNSHVTTAAPAKRITFYKSGDSQFGGVRMAIHKRSFKCFDALLDDLSQKVPLPFGVRTVTTPRGTHIIKHLEQLQDGGCYLCSDRRQAKPINMELASKRQGIWYHHGRRPQRPESSPATPPGHFHLPSRQRRVLLVKNSEPSVRRSIILTRRSTRSLKAFLDEASEVMQFHVRKLYTAEGRRIDSVQSLMTCPGVLVCVGREAFSPMFINFIRKTSEEKLPGLGNKSPGHRIPGNGARSPVTQGIRSSPHGAQSRTSEYDEAHDGKKNVNFGLETKKSIIHPRSDSSNRSTRVSLSSEKSYGVCSQGRPAIMNDDIEKRVLVNKDGSLSLEMRVRFRLQNDETIQWSTQINKSPSLTNDCLPLSQAQPNYLPQGQSESCSDPDSTSYEGGDYSSQPPRCASEENRCPCCYQRRDDQFDLWTNPTNKYPPVPPTQSSHNRMRHTHSSSSSSSCNSRRVVRCRARLSRSPGGSGSEQSQVVQKETCVTEQVEHRVEVDHDGDTQVEVCKVSRCCSQTEVVAMETNLQPLGGKSVDGDLMMAEEEPRPLSAVSSTSHVLQSLKEDQDDEEEDLPPSASQCSHREEPTPSPTPGTHHKEPERNLSANSVQSLKYESHKEKTKMGSRVSSPAPSCHCRTTTPHSPAEANEAEREPASRSNLSETKEAAADVEGEETNRSVSDLSHHTGHSASSQKSWKSNVCPNCGGWKRGVNSNSRASNPINPSSPISTSRLPNKENGLDTESLSALSNMLEGRATSATPATSNPDSKEKDQRRAPSSASVRSYRSDISHKSHCNGVSDVTADRDNDRSSSVLSGHSNLSNKSKHAVETLVINSGQTEEEERAAERTTSSLSNKSGTSIKSEKPNGPSQTPDLSTSDRTVAEEDNTDRRAPSKLSVRSNVSGKAESVLSSKSTKSNISAKSETTQTSAGPKAELDEAAEEEEIKERSSSTMTAKTNVSARSNKSASVKSNSPMSKTRINVEERATSQMSGKLSVISTKSSLSLKMADKAEESKRIEAETPEIRMLVNSENDERSVSAGSHHTNTDMDRSPSATSGRSHDSVKSTKSQRSKHTMSPNARDTDVPLSETNRDENVKSRSSVRSCASHTSNSSRNLSSPKKTGGGDDEEENTSDQRQTDSPHKSNHSEAADISIIETAETGETVENCAPRCKSTEETRGQTLSPRRTPSPRTRPSKSLTASPKHAQSQQLFLDGEASKSSALSVHSSTSSKSGRSRCCCGAAPALDKDKNIKGEHKEDERSEGASEQALSIVSSSSKKQRNESTTTQPLSRNSSGSVSLGLPEDQDETDSDSGKSSVFCDNTEARITNKAKIETPDVSKSPNNSSIKEEERTASTKSPHPPAVDIPTIKTPQGGEDGGEREGEQTRDRAASASTIKSSKSRKSCCNRVNAAVQKHDGKSKKRNASASPTKAENTDETGSIKSTSTTKTNKRDTLSGNTSALSGNINVRRKFSSSVKSTNVDNNISGVLTNTETENQDISNLTSKSEEMEDVTDNMAQNIGSQSPRSLRQRKTAPKQSDVTQGLDKSGGLNPVKEPGNSSLTGSEAGSTKVPSSGNKTPIKSPSPSPVHNPRPGSKIEAGSESTMSHSLPAADMLLHTVAAARPHSQQSKTSDKSQSGKSERSLRSRSLKDQKEVVELTPECLPNASPNEVVSNWLQSIPANSSMLVPDNEVNQEDLRGKESEEEPEDELEKEDLSHEEEQEESDEDIGSHEQDKEDKTECDAACPGDPVGMSPRSRNWQCSAAVMKVLLSSSLGRCRSMPEVSPVYGRRLSTSARGLLDCLAQLQLIEPGVCSNSHQQKERKQQYDEVMAILQSLWFTDARDVETKENKANGGSEQVTPTTSSSGVGMSSGSDGSGKGNGNQGEEEAHAKEIEPLHEEAAENVAEEEDGGGDKDKECEETLEEETTEKQVKSEEQSTVPQSLESQKATENPSSSGSKSPTDNERETMDDSCSGTPPITLRATLSKRLSQDPDPMWVLNLLKKLEKQFMSHYIEAMAEFKVRWDLDDSLLLDTMIAELRDEVSRRIQSSIQREVRKIQSRAGKGGRAPRPPQLANLSRDSTMTEKRRRMLKVMKNQSVKTADSLSDEEMTGSDQRSDDEYCPCDACVRKKMAARPFKKNPLAAEAPVMMEFDLRKILQLKKSPLPATASQPVEEEDEKMTADEEGRNLEVVEEEEEEEETKEDIKADVVLEEVITEEDEEVEKEKDKSEEDEEQEEGETSEPSETSENEEEEDEGQLSHPSPTDKEESNKDEEGGDIEETSNFTGEDETGENEEESESEEEEEEDEESDKETVKEATSAEGEDLETGRDSSAQDAANRNVTVMQVTVEGNVSSSAEDEDDGNNSAGEEESQEAEKEVESLEQDEEASEEEKESQQSQSAIPAVCVTEGEEADAEDSDESKPEDSECDEFGGSNDEEEKDSRDEENKPEEDLVEEFKPEDESEEETLLHQDTRTSVESQPGSMEDDDADSPSNPVDSTEDSRVAEGVSAGDHRSSQSRANIKRCKPKEEDN